MTRFISFEGLDGLGKSTQASLLSKWLHQKNIANVLTREPGGTPIAEALRNIFLQDFGEKMRGETELLLLFAARVQHLHHTILPQLADGKWVLSDRYIDSSFAYQGGGRGIEWQRIAFLEDWLCKEHQPDLTILFVAPLELVTQRLLKRLNTGTTDRIESAQNIQLEFYDKVQKAYEKRAAQDPSRILCLQANRPIEALFQSIIEALEIRGFL